MSQKWRKLGIVYLPNGEHGWDLTHAAVPIAENIGGDIFRIYFSSRNNLNKSYTGWILIDIKSPQVILEKCSNPIISPGDLGTFDESGAMATWLAHWNDKKYIYYIGWNLGVTVPFRNSIGLTICENQSNFIKHAEGPILDRTTHDPYFVASCCVIPGEDKWRMWYLSCSNWRVRNSKIEHRYHIKYAESRNGIDWDRNNIVAIDYKDDLEYAISRPSVINDDGIWKMWFSARGDSYRICYAESENGINWTRKDGEVDLDISSNGWDSEMIEYPFVFDHQGARYMLYNGNGYGESGFGLAILEQR